MLLISAEEFIHILSFTDYIICNMIMKCFFLRMLLRQARLGIIQDCPPLGSRAPTSPYESGAR
jgi:hypothetical protein